MRLIKVGLFTLEKVEDEIKKCYHVLVTHKDYIL